MDLIPPTVRDAGDGEQRWFCGGGLHTWKATSAETGGVFILFEDNLEKGKLTPLHRHPGIDETFIMLDGEILVDLPDGRLTVGAGGIAVIPRDTPHAFMVTSSTARMLCLQTPGDGEAFFRQASDPVEPGVPPSAVDFGRVQAAAEATGSVEMLGPPPFSA